MARAEDFFTSTVDGAAAFERHHGEEPYDDRPTLAECERDEWEFEHGEDPDEA